jgi:hypothetical protein
LKFIINIVKKNKILHRPYKLYFIFLNLKSFDIKTKNKDRIITFIYVAGVCMQKKDVSIVIGRKKYVVFELVFNNKIKINKDNKEKT